MRWAHVDTSWGTFTALWNKNGVTQLLFPGAPVPEGRASQAPLELVAQLTSYLKGELQVFSLPLAPGGSSFQFAVWDVLRSTPYGTTTSYGQLARRIGRHTAARAVGGAIARNPIPVMIPCHRVLPASGALGSFGPGPAWKARLLELEGAWGEYAIGVHQAARLPVGESGRSL